MKLGIALSGGGIRGIAHAGVLKALEENNIHIDIIGGTSAGSMVATLYALGYKPEEILEIFKKYAKQIANANSKPFLLGLKNFIFKNSKQLQSLNDGATIEKVYDKISKERGIININEISMPIVIPTVDILSSREYIFTNKIPNLKNDKTNKTNRYITDIEIGKAVRASSSFPAVFSPCKIGKHAFMDGGALDNVPVDEVRKQGADRVIAVKFDADPVDENSNLMDIVMKTIDIMGNKIAEKNLEGSDIVLNVCTDKVGLLDVGKLDSCYNYGYECVIDNLEKIKNQIKN